MANVKLTYKYTHSLSQSIPTDTQWKFLSPADVTFTETFSGGDSYISSCDALLGNHEDEADEDGRPQHADGAHEWVGSLCLLAAQACGGCSNDHA